MTTDNIRASIERALAAKPHEGNIPRISKREAQHIVDAARQGAGPQSHEESVYVAAFVLGPEHPQLREILDGADVELPDFGRPGRDYAIDDAAEKVFDAFFRRHAVPVAGGRGSIVEEMTQQLLDLGKGRPRLPDGRRFRVALEDARGDRWVGWLDADERRFFVERPEAAGNRGPRYHGPFVLDGHVDPAKR